MSPRPSIPDRRAVVLAAAEELILEVGFDAMTMQTLARAVGIGKGSLYLEFPSKEALLDDLLQQATARVMVAVQPQGDPSAAPSLSEGYVAAAAALIDEPLLCAAFLDDTGVLGRQVAGGQDGRYALRHQRVRDWIGLLRDSGRLRADVDIDGLALALSSATIGLLTAAKLVGPVTREQLLAALDALAEMTRGLETEPPRGSDPKV